MTPLLVDRKGLAIVISVSEATISKLLKNGKIPFIKVGARTLYNPLRVVEALETGIAAPENGGVNGGLKYAA